MLARAVPRAVVCVCEDRHLAGTLAERHLGATVHLLDDGFQHVQLERDLDILLTSPGEIGQGRVLPFGRLREAPAAAARAGIVVVVDADHETARSEAWELGISQFAAARRRIVLPPGAAGATPTGATGATGATGDDGLARHSPEGANEGSPRHSPEGANEGPPRHSPEGATAGAIAVAGIAKPAQFFEMLREAGCVLASTIAFPDHHRYSAKDLARIETELRRTGSSSVLSTEKDLVRFEAVAPLPFEVTAIPMSLEIDGWDTLAAAVMAALDRRRAGNSCSQGDV